jgi:16S rRNA (cytidine1402-2'-O)-methyltransferase
MHGTLYVVGTPIGNLEDISLRALRILREVDLIACEDTRHTSKLLEHYGIGTPRQSYHEHNEATRTPQMVALLQEGKNVALVSDAGMPLVSDPGYPLVSACRREGIEVVPIPGPSAVIAALAGCGLPVQSFAFHGFLPARASLRRKKLEEVQSAAETLVFYEAPHRIIATLHDMVQLFGPRQACLARELTKVHEEWIRGTLPEILDSLRLRPRVQGEITLVVEGGKPAAAPMAFPVSVLEHLEMEIATGLSRSEALKSLARQRGISRKEAYRLLLHEKSSTSE